MDASKAKLKEVRLKTPVGSDALESLEIGNVVYLDGLVYTGREGVYRKVIDQGAAPPAGVMEMTNVNFHCSPAASVAADGSHTIGAVTATASFRFSKWMKPWFALSGAKVIIGKGGMSGADYRALFVPAGAVYLTTVGYGTGALLGRGIKGVRQVHWLEELGIAQALWVLEVEGFGPFLVECDRRGNSLFDSNNREINAGFSKLYAGLKPPSLSRFGETDDREDELI
jgi:L(+)-tartrate dehydratase beta subunit